MLVPFSAVGLRMDTIWRIIRVYVASILTVVIGTVRIPIALSFGPVEDTGFSDTFYTTRRERFDFDLSAYIIESDQGFRPASNLHEIP
jgi:hypothetical protein